MKISIIAPLTYFDMAYSLTGVVLDQASMFAKEGHDVSLVLARGAEGSDFLKDVQFSVVPGIHPGEKERTKKDFVEICSSSDVVITHDIAWVEYNSWLDDILREIEPSLPNVRFFHQIHSAPGSETCIPQRKARELDNVSYVYGSKSWIPKLSKYINARDGQVNHARYTHGYVEFMEGSTTGLYEQLGLLDADIVGFFPAHPMPGKMLPAILKIIAEMKSRGEYSIKYVFTVNGCPPGSAAGKRVSEYKQMAKDLDIENECVWMNEFDEWKNSVPYDVVQAIWKITNLFINPSLSEVNSLMTVEAMFNKCFIVANIDCPPVVEQLGRTEDGDKYNGAIFHSFGNHQIGEKIQTKESLQELVTMMFDFLKKNLSIQAQIRAKRLYNPRRVYEQEWSSILKIDNFIPEAEVIVEKNVSVVIPIFNLTEELVLLTQKAITSVRQCASAQVILVQNYPEDTTEYDYDVMITNTHNVGVAKAWNQGIAAAKTEYIAVMNSDIELPEVWFEEMKKWAMHNTIVFPWVKDKCVGNGEGLILDEKFKFPDTHGSCFMARRAVFNKVGPFDEHFFAYGEDKDYWKRCVLSEVHAYRANVQTSHVMNATSGTLSNEKKLIVEGKVLTLTELLERNNEYFMQKWGEPL